MKHILISLLMQAAALVIPAGAATPPMTGEKAPDFVLSGTGGKTVRLSDITRQEPVVLIVLRGYPGYQCPYCGRQVQDFLSKSMDFANAGVRVVMVYPGPGQQLDAKASEFLAGRTLPANFDLLLDPDYRFTNLYGLRWDAPRETAYPTTFVIDRHGVIGFSKISKEHGGRTSAAEVLAILSKIKLSDN